MSETTLFPEPAPSLQLSNVANTVRLVVLQFVAWMTKRQPVGDLESEFGMARERFYVVGAKISSFARGAFLTNVSVTLKHSFSPNKVFWLSSVVQRPLGSAVAKVVASGSARTMFANVFTDLGFRFYAVLSAYPNAPRSFDFHADQPSGFGRVLFAFERRRSALLGLPNLNQSTTTTCRRQTVESAAVALEKCSRLPGLASCALLQPCSQAATVFRYRQARFLRGNFNCALRGLCHSSVSLFIRLLDSEKQSKS
jgi:hypothetical protein